MNSDDTECVEGGQIGCTIIGRCPERLGSSAGSDRQSARPLAVGAHLDLAINRFEEACKVQTGAPGAGDYRGAEETLAQ